MNSKISLLLFGLLVTLAVLAAAENSEENTLSEEVASSRLARSADADAGQKKKKSSKKSKKNKKKSRKAAKKAAKKAKKAAKKAKKNAGKSKNKSVKKNKRKNKKSRKNNKKTDKKSKKAAKKAAKKAERKEKKAARKEKKNKTIKKNKSNKSQKERQTGRTVDGTCLESATIAMNRWRGVVANFLKQKTRIEKQSEIAGKKGGKKSVFAPIALKLVDLGGGNKSALTCSGSADSDGAKQLTNLTQTLFDCEVQVNTSCSMDFPAPNMTFVDECTMDIEMFENKTEECYKLSKADTAADACTCWTDPAYAELGNKVKSCKIAEVSDVAKGLKACKDAFSTCRKFEDDAVASMAACSVSADTLKAKAAALSANVASTNDAAAKVAEVTGASSRRRSARAAATSCADFITLVEQLVAILLDFPASPQVIVVGGYIVASAEIACTEDEIASLVETESSLTEAAEFLVEAFEEANENLLEATGSTLSPAELLEFTEGPEVTTVASRFRMRGFQRQLFKH